MAINVTGARRQLLRDYLMMALNRDEGWELFLDAKAAEALLARLVSERKAAIQRQKAVLDSEAAEL